MQDLKKMLKLTYLASKVSFPTFLATTLEKSVPILKVCSTIRDFTVIYVSEVSNCVMNTTNNMKHLSDYF